MKYIVYYIAAFDINTFFYSPKQVLQEVDTPSRFEDKNLAAERAKECSSKGALVTILEVYGA